jgi:uncharacterized membrane protein HdeD (DUF308 family)
MAQVLFRKWWVLLLQGILLIILSIYIFNNPVGVLAGLSFWFGLLVLLAGLTGVIAFLAGSKEERENMSLLWSILAVAFGLLMTTHMLATMKLITVVLGWWILLSGILLLNIGWSAKKTNSGGWLVVLAGIFSVIAGIMVIFDIGSGAVAVSTLLGLQVLFSGIALIVLSFAKKAVKNAVKDRIGSIKESLKD